MKPLLRIILVLAFWGLNKGYAQYSLEVGAIMPTGDFSYEVKPAPSFELFFNTGDIDSRYKFCFGLGYFGLTPTADTFRITGFGGNGVLEPGYQVIQNYEEVPITLRNEYAIWGDRKFSPFISLDLCFYLISFSHQEVIENSVNSSTYNDTFWLLSIVPRIGLQYKLSGKFLLTGGLARSMGFTGTVDDQAFWQPFVGIKYYPN